VSDIFDELQWRGLVAETTDQEALRGALAGGPVTFYCGFDPTAPSLHMGNLVQLILMRHLQRAGHRPLCLVGGSTGLIGDPKATAERTLSSPETVAAWVARIQDQMQPFLDFDGENPASMVNNLDWTAPMSALDFLRDVGKHFRVNAMIKKDAIATRLASQDGISYTEFSYQLLQALDYLHLFRTYGCTLQTGGVDQWGNLTAGSDLIHRAEHESVHLMTTPLVTKADGTKFGKTESGTVWLDPEMMSPYAFYQFWINAEDASVIGYLKIFTDRTREEVDRLEVSLTETPFKREAQRALAADVTTLVHGAAATAAVQAASEALFGKGDPAVLDPHTLRDATAELPGGEVAPGDTVVDALIATGLVDSRNAARRVITDGGVSLNNAKVSDPERVLTDADFLHGQVALVRRGRKSLAAARKPT
jgi:tyrosyl-tRNA synthetase